MSDFDELMTKDDIAEYVKLYTEPMGDPPTAPFHWQIFNVNTETGQVTQKVSTLINPSCHFSSTFLIGSLSK